MSKKLTIKEILGEHDKDWIEVLWSDNSVTYIPKYMIKGKFKCTNCGDIVQIENEQYYYCPVCYREENVKYHFERVDNDQEESKKQKKQNKKRKDPATWTDLILGFNQDKFVKWSSGGYKNSTDKSIEINTICSKLKMRFTEKQFYMIADLILNEIEEANHELFMIEELKEFILTKIVGE
jgi:hypothetical protein